MAGPITFVAATGSTNADLAAQIARGDAPASGAWLVSDRQLAGRGRQGRSWIDAPGNFMGSTAVRIEASDPPLASLSFVAALALYGALIPQLANPSSLQLKWPNDLLLDGAKLSGILLERVGDYAVIGTGVNLVAAPPVEGRDVASLTQSGTAALRIAFAEDLARSMDSELQAWRKNGTAPLFRRWLAVAHAPGTPLMVHASTGKPVSGQFDGLEDDGALRLRLADGTTHVIHAGDVSMAG